MTTYARPVVNGTPTTGQTIKAAHINEPVDFIFDTVLAGGITDDQLGALSVTEGKIATGAVTQTKIEGTLPDGADLAAATQASDPDLTVADKGYVDGLVPDSNGLIKGWVVFDGTDSGTITPGASYNVTSVVKTATGTYTITWDTDFADGNYALSGMAATFLSNIVGVQVKTGTTPAAGSVEVFVGVFDGDPYDSAYVSVMAVGAQ